MNTLSIIRRLELAADESSTIFQDLMDALPDASKKAIATVSKIIGASPKVIMPAMRTINARARVGFIGVKIDAILRGLTSDGWSEIENLDLVELLCGRKVTSQARWFYKKGQDFLIAVQNASSPSKGAKSLGVVVAGFNLKS